MLLQTGGETRFQMRPIEGVELGPHSEKLAELLILDGQQRLTYLTQVLSLNSAVSTRDSKRKEIRLHYYIDIKKALEGPEALSDAIFGVDESRTLKSDFGRRIDLDLSSPVLAPFRSYMLPVITRKKETSKQAVCLVFEKVNTGGVPLSVFELVTATWAADGFNLRDDWFGGRGKKGRRAELTKKPLLKDIQATDFLQGISLIHSYNKRQDAARAGRIGKELPPLTAKREHVLETPLSAYRDHADKLQAGFLEAERFLRDQGFHHPKFIPYRSQLTPLAALLSNLGNRWREPQIKSRLAQWYWCGVLGELYGGAVESKIALDYLQLMTWIEDPKAPEPATIQSASFNPNRLDTMRSRVSAAYRGLYVLLQREGAQDFFWKSTMKDLDYDEVKIDIHHIFPKKWCQNQGIAPQVYDAIVNKTAISYKANRMIGGDAPSKYLAMIQNHKQVQLADPDMDAILRTHFINPAHLRADGFEDFYQDRKKHLLNIIEAAMGKTSNVDAELAEDTEVEDE